MLYVLNLSIRVVRKLITPFFALIKVYIERIHAQTHGLRWVVIGLDTSQETTPSLVTGPPARVCITLLGIHCVSCA